MQEVLVGGVAFLLAEWAKKHPNIPLSPDNVVAIRSVVAALSIVGTVLTALADGNLATMDWSTPVRGLVDAGSSFLVATGAYALLRSRLKGGAST